MARVMQPDAKARQLTSGYYETHRRFASAQVAWRSGDDSASSPGSASAKTFTATKARAGSSSTKPPSRTGLGRALQVQRPISKPARKEHTARPLGYMPEKTATPATNFMATTIQGAESAFSPGSSSESKTFTATKRAVPPSTQPPSGRIPPPARTMNVQRPVSKTARKNIASPLYYTSETTATPTTNSMDINLQQLKILCEALGLPTAVGLLQQV
ncbi:hypothetical protein T484DRAFT_1788517 [Baffinella frigidus]|nr:hypothetical protein T484DRAFT_1788517 [Cryptophyta sp. CCMP2293]